MIESFTEATSNVPSPEIFRKWSAIVAVAGALERRVKVCTADGEIFPNLFVLLVSPPGVGKTQAARKTADLWKRTDYLKVAPDDITKAALVDAVDSAKQVFVPDGKPLDMMYFHSMQVVADELGVLLPAHDLSFMSVMNKMFDCVDYYHESRRGRDEDLMIEKPQVTMLAGTQPDFLASLLPPEAWGMGFMSRIIMVYAGSPVKTQLFGKRKHNYNRANFIPDLKQICKLYGEMDFTQEAMDELVRLHDEGIKPIPQHLKLKHYLPRRLLNLLKLCMISSASRGDSMEIDLFDVNRAKDWLIEAESFIPEIFKDMSGKSDRDVIQDLHNFVWQTYTANNKKSVHRSRIEAFLINRTPAYNVKNIIDVCVSSKILINTGPDLFTPGTTNDSGWDT